MEVLILDKRKKSARSRASISSFLPKIYAEFLRDTLRYIVFICVYLCASVVNISAGGSSTPIRGMYFLHPDHLGSVRMITDAYGRIAAIGDTGASNIRYKPFGEISRGNSYGPDIFRYKYTAQQEDIESGLYYYNSRYYDPNIGQFLQADSVIGLN
ncbi:MAG: hypothetical protein H7A23_13180, partial [Leptospiraceae bacterium]|nr:hypothetical protein [Leptospiraceae bacterium]